MPPSAPRPPQAAPAATRRIVADDRQAQALARLDALRAGAATDVPLDLAGVRLIDVDLSGLDLSQADLTGSDLSRARLRGATLFGARLCGATLFEADLGEAELSGADLADANLEAAVLARAGLGLANLRGAQLPRADLRGATLTEAVLEGANLQGARLEGARARHADLAGADLSRCDLRQVELDASRVDGATLDGADLRGASLAGVRGFERASWLGVDLREVDFTGAWRCRGFIQDQNYLEEFRTHSRWTRAVYVLWKLTSDCGRSVGRWAFVCGVMIFLFTWLYTLVEVDYGDHPTAISPLYYSVVTITTLGFGDVVPASIGGQLVAMAEVITGYVMLGGLLSIFSNKMASRAG